MSVSMCTQTLSVLVLSGWLFSWSGYVGGGREVLLQIFAFAKYNHCLKHAHIDEGSFILKQIIFLNYLLPL